MRRSQAKKQGISHPYSYSFMHPRQGIKKRHRFVLPMALPRQMAGLYSVAHYLLLVVLHPQPIFKRFSGNADHVSNPDRLELAGVCQLISRGFSNAENSGYVLHGVGPVFRRLLFARYTHNLPPVSCRRFAHTYPVSLTGKALTDTLPAKNLLI